MIKTLPFTKSSVENSFSWGMANSSYEGQRGRPTTTEGPLKGPRERGGNWAGESFNPRVREETVMRRVFDKSYGATPEGTEVRLTPARKVINAHDVTALDKQLATIVGELRSPEGAGIKAVTVDLRNLNRLESNGLAAFVVLQAAAQEAGATMKIVVNDRIMDVFAADHMQRYMHFELDGARVRVWPVTPPQARG